MVRPKTTTFVLESGYFFCKVLWKRFEPEAVLMFALRSGNFISGFSLIQEVILTVVELVIADSHGGEFHLVHQRYAEFPFECR